MDMPPRAITTEDSKDTFPLNLTQQLPEGADHVLALIENTSDIIAVLTATGYIRYTSPSTKRVLGYVPTEWIDTEIYAYMHPDDEQTARATFAHTLEHLETARTGEVRFRHCHGSWRVMEV